MVMVLRLKKPLYMAAGASTILTILLFGFTPTEAASALGQSLVQMSTWRVLAIIYMISLLQVMMEKKGLFDVAREGLMGLSDKLRLNMTAIPIFVGILPAPGSVLIAAPMVDQDCKNYLTPDEKTFYTSFVRHIPEAWLPTYSTVILATELTGITVSQYMIYMTPIALVALAVPYYLLMRKLPKLTGESLGENKAAAAGQMLKGLWAILLLIVLILVFQVSVQVSALIVLLSLAVIGRYSVKEMGELIVKGFNKKMLLSTYAVMIFSYIVGQTGALEALPPLFETLPIPSWLTFGLLFLLATMVGGLEACVIMVMPMAFAAIPNAGPALVAYLMSFGWVAMQLTPVHICLTLITEFYETKLQTLIAKTIPIGAIVLGFSTIYYLVLSGF